MDTITHAVSGVVLSRAGFAASLKRPAAVAFIIGAVLPDIDHFPLWLMGTESYLANHRGLTHSLPGSILMALALSALLGWYYRRKSRDAIPLRPLFIVSLVALNFHIFLDLITSYGTMVLYPFSKERFSCNLVFIIDLYVTGLFLAALIVPYLLRHSRWRGSKKRLSIVAARASIALFFLYLVFASVNHYRAEYNAERTGLEASALAGDERLRLIAYPGPFSPFNWMVIMERDGEFILFRDVLGPGPVEIERYRNSPADKYTEAAMANSFVKTYLWFADFPLITSSVTKQGHVVELFDLRFYSLPPRRPFVLSVELDDEARIERLALE